LILLVKSHSLWLIFEYSNKQKIVVMSPLARGTHGIHSVVYRGYPEILVKIGPVVAGI